MNRREFVKRAAAVVVASAAARARGQQASPAQSAIPRRPLGKTGVDVPVLILGGVAGMKQAPTLSFHPAQLAEAALDAGINYFDTAPSYANGQSESNYGEVLATRRKEVFLACKTEKRSYDEALRGVEASLKRLRTDHLDLLQLHGVTAKEDFTKWDGPSGVLKAMYKLRDEKVTRFLGVTGHESAEAMRKAIELFDFDTILTTFNPTVRRRPFQELVLPLAR
jgi:aryl-alcohol dehydrogenase-like predicted oxidoreductase